MTEPRAPAAVLAGEPPDRLIRDLVDAREQLAASDEILTALGRSGREPGRVLDTIVERAAALCDADAAQLYLVRDGAFALSRATGRMPEAFLAYVAEHPLPMTRASLLGRVALDRRTQQIRDVLADPGYGRQDLQRLAGYRTLLVAPMIVDDDVVGELSLWRTRVRSFDGRATRLLEAFATQAAVVLKTVALMGALEVRTGELGSKVSQLEALREVGEAVSSSLDLDEVLQTVVTHAVRLTRTDGGSIMEYVEEEEAFSVRAAYGSSPQMLDQLRSVRIRRDSTLVGRAALEGRPLVVEDLAEARLDPHLEVLLAHGWRSVLAVPMRRQDRMVGALVIRRRAPGRFDRETVELLETFAGQSALAILNARLFRQLATSRAEVEVASRHKSEFLASMSHELRTPLNAVIGFSEVLLDQLFGELNERQEEYLRDIWNSGRHLLELLNEILDLSKVEAGQMRLDPTVVEVADVLERARALVRERAVSHRIGLEVDVAPDVGTVRLDALRLKQVVVNLLSNAVKFTPDGGLVTLRARRTPEELQVTVTDTGVGVPEEDRERIFESFQQGGRGAPREEGTGLGLTLCRRIVTLFGGRMWVESEVGVGSTFGFAVPAAPASPGGAGPAVGHDTGAGGRPRVVVADDDRASVQLLSAYLEGAGVDVVGCADGEDALAEVARRRPDAVLLDVRLPGIDGWEVLARLRADPAQAGLPVVMVTVVDDRERGVALGAAGHLVKPVSRETLLRALRDAGVVAGAEAG